MVDAVPDFVHLHLHTQYSLLDGAIRIDPLLDRVKDFGMTAVAITDHGTMFGAIDFYKKAIAAGIKPIIGCECYVAPGSIQDRSQADKRGRFHLILLAETTAGYRNLCRLVSIANLDGFYYRPRVDKALLKTHTEGIIALSACLQGEVPRRILENRIDAADQAAIEYQEIFGEGNFFLEVQNNGIKAQVRVNETLRDMSQRLSIPLVASNDCHYLDQDDVTAHEVLLCIQTGKTIHDPNRFKFQTDQLYFKSRAEMAADFEDYPGALANTVEIARRCQVEFDFETFHFPKFDTGTEQSVEDAFRDQVQGGFQGIMEKILRKDPQVDQALYKKRLEDEMTTIVEMGFAGYFLIVADFIRYAKEKNIPVGPGRGSAAGSLVAYSLGITDLDPIAYGLIFERFLNPARKSMPDIDVDFCINGREDVFKYVVAKYGGEDYVAQIITYGKMQTRAVIRDVGRALDIPLPEVDTIAKMVPDVIGVSLDEALAMEPRIVKMARDKPEVAELIKICRVLEGLPRHASTHAAGVVIADKPLVNYMPLYRGKKGEVTTQYDMNYVEKIGLIKFDFLGLRNLTVIQETLRLIKAQGREVPDMADLNLDDSDTYRLLQAADTTGVFQLESSGMKSLLARLRPERFDDIIALVALYRPGPLESGMVDDFVERKHGRKKVQYLLPELEPILKPTHGVIVYQEQVMKIAGVLANYQMAEADDLRKAMGKKIKAIMAEHRSRFIDGAADNQIPRKKAETIFDLIEKFGGYGFNKSHSAAYALIAYQTAYLKAHFPVEMLAALLTSAMHSTDGVVKYIAECRHQGIDVLPPDINTSETTFTVQDGKIRFGLVAVKNVGEGVIEAMIAIRSEGGRFDSLFDFCERMELTKFNKRVIESLIKSGAFDSTGEFRSRMMAVLDDAAEYGQRIQREKNNPQMGLFDLTGEDESVSNYPPVPQIDEWDPREMLALEKESLGFYISGHPLDTYRDVVEKYSDVDALTLSEKKDGQTVRVGGIVSAIKEITSKNGRMAFVSLEDINGVIEVTVFSRLFSQVETLVCEGRVVFVEGEVQKRETEAKILAGNVIPIEKAEETWTADVHLTLDVDRANRKILERLYELLSSHPGACRGFLHLIDPSKTETIISLPDDLKVTAGSSLNREVRDLLGFDAVKTTILSAVAVDNGKRKQYIRRVK